MSLIVPNESELLMLQYMLNVTTVTNPVLRLFGNDITPDANTTFGDVTEITAGGYAEITLSPTDWTITAESGVGVAVQPKQTFTVTEAETVYGYYITNQANTKLLWIQRAEFAPASLPINGTFSVTPKFRARSVN